MIVEDQILKKIQMLNEMGYSILFINNTYYHAVYWKEADKDVPFHALKGQNITSLLLTLGDISKSEKQVENLVENTTQNLTVHNIQFSHQMSYIYFTREVYKT